VRHRIFLGWYRGIIKNQIKTELRRKNIKYPDGAGIGVYLALILYSEIEDCSRFSNKEKAFSYAGLVPRVHQSGNTSYSAKHF
jgi:hypothetical protein